MTKAAIYFTKPCLQWSVHIETQLIHPVKFYDGDEPVELHPTLETVPLLNKFVAGLANNTCWVTREWQVDEPLKSGFQPDGITQVTLYRAKHARRTPAEWFRIVFDESQDLCLEVAVLDEALAIELFDAFCCGHLKMRYADPVLA